VLMIDSSSHPGDFCLGGLLLLVVSSGALDASATIEADRAGLIASGDERITKRAVRAESSLKECQERMVYDSFIHQ
jgi:hypothetical protein